MSYARIGPGSDVYVYPTGGRVCCAWCTLAGGDKLLDHAEMLQHLQDHRDAGAQVPEEAFDRLRREVAEMEQDEDDAV